MAVNIMIQGTMSNAGKSLIAAGLCRVFAQDGYRVAPFKSQNMALNSCVTEEGLEMGRAQAVQAEACGVRPSVRMNPVLLKPTTDIGSQVIVMGKVRANMKASDYFRYKKELIPEIMEAYGQLASENDIIVIEGAGSPAEINLKSEDIVNMGLAEMVDAPVLLVGDIDRGGVFAQLAGTILLLEEKEKDRICGMIINKFRGDVSILEPGLKMIEEICQKPVLGVVPYAPVDIEDEDSLSERLENQAERYPVQNCQEEDGQCGMSEEKTVRILHRNCGEREEESEEDCRRGFLDIAVVRLPRISNFTDFDALSGIGGVRLRYTETPSELLQADIIILPGTKNTIGDLEWLRRTGNAEAVLRRSRAGARTIGICGGYQMLGNSVADENGAESAGRSRAAGLGLLPLETVFQQEKTLGQISGLLLGSGFLDGETCHEDIRISGYEIHMGSSRVSSGYEEECRPLLQLDDGRLEGCVFGNVMGTYLHGIFDNRRFTERLLRDAAERKGILSGDFQMTERRAYKEMQYDRLAEIIRASLDMEKIYEIMGLSAGEN